MENINGLNRIALLLVICSLVGCVSSSIPGDGQQPGVDVKSANYQKPFQVIYAESAFRDSSKTTVNQFDLIGRNELIKLKKGILLVARFDGEFFEFEGNQIIDFKQHLRIPPVIPYKRKMERPEVGRLFRDSLLSDKFYLGRWGAHHRVMALYFPFLNPDENKFQFKKDSVFRLHWVYTRPYEESNLPDKFTFKITNVYDEEITTIETTNNFVDLDLSQFRDKNESGFYLVSVSGKNDAGRGFNSYELAFVESEWSNFHDDFNCKTNVAIEALEQAYTHERSGEIYYAKKYYDCASTLSDRKIYTELKDNFLNRVSF
ncbi:MAG: hypothetical protein AAFQ94_11820 [Bacteroidota bacterium]